MSVIGDLVINLAANTQKFTGPLDTARSKLASVGASMRDTVMSMTGLGGLLTGAGIVAAVSKTTSLAQVQIDAERKLAAVLQATGGAAGYSAQELYGYASSLQAATNFGDELTINAMAILGTFKNINGTVFKETVALGQDMASVLGTDLNGAMLQLGKALNDPVTGLTALRRAGVSFSEEQKTIIKSLVESGDLLGAQKIILAELKAEFGGAAQAMADPITQAKNAIGDLGETIGASLLPMVSALATNAVTLIPLTLRLVAAWAGAKIAIFAINAALAAYNAYQKATIAGSILLQALAGPAAWIKIGAGIAAAGIAIAGVNKMLAGTTAEAAALTRGALPAAMGKLTDTTNEATDALEPHTQAIKKASDAWMTFEGHFRSVASVQEATVANLNSLQSTLTQTASVAKEMSAGIAAAQGNGFNTLDMLAMPEGAASQLADMQAFYDQLGSMPGSLGALAQTAGDSLARIAEARAKLDEPIGESIEKWEAWHAGLAENTANYLAVVQSEMANVAAAQSKLEATVTLFGDLPKAIDYANKALAGIQTPTDQLNETRLKLQALANVDLLTQAQHTELLAKAQEDFDRAIGGPQQRIEDMRSELERLTTGASEASQELARLAETPGVTPEQIAEIQRLQEQIDSAKKSAEMQSEGKRLAESLMTPVEKAQEEIKRAEELFAGGHISKDIMDRAIARARESLAEPASTAEESKRQDFGYRGTEALQAGSAAAFSRILAAMYHPDKKDDTAKNTKATADGIRNAVKVLEDIRDQEGVGIPA